MADFLLNNPKLQSSLDANTNSIVNVVDPTLDQDAATKKYTDDADALLVPYTGATGDVDLGANDLTTTGNLAIRSDAGYIDLGAAADDYKIQWDGSDAVHTITAGDFVFTGGNVGIGVTDPDKTLEINGSARLSNDSDKFYFGAADDAYLEFDGNSLNIVANAVTATDDLEMTARTIKTTGGRVVTTTRYTTTQAIPVTDHAVFCDTDDGAFTVTLPAGVDGQEFFITNCGSGGFALTIACNGAETINGDATQLIYDAESVHVVYETTEGWRIF